MLIPWLRGFLLPTHAPLTWLLFFANVLIFLAMSLQSSTNDQEFSDYFSDSENIRVQGYVFARFVQSHAEEYSPVHTDFAKRALAGHDRALKALGALALRDVNFTEKAADFKFGGDQIAIEEWRGKFYHLVDSQKDRPGYRFGLSRVAPAWVKTLTYQFVHSDYSHLLSNMFCLLIFGCVLEMVIGGAFFIFSYLFAGVIAAVTFTMVTGLSDAPLVGASGAINGLVGFFAVLFWKREVTFLFLLLPKKGFHGMIDLGWFWFLGFVKVPAWVFVMIWVAADMAALMASVTEFGGVAYSAHLGGLATGVLLGTLFLFRSKASAQGIFRDQARL